MNIRIASLAVAIAFVSFPAYAQRPGSAGETIKSLSDKLAALTERVAKLESGHVDAADLAGKYVIHALGIELHGGFPASISSETTVGIATFNADHTGSFTGADGRWDLQQGAPWTLGYHTTDQSGDFTWSLVDGNVVIPGDEDAVLTVGAGGRVLAGGGTSTSGGWSNIFLVIRLPNP